MSSTENCRNLSSLRRHLASVDDVEAYWTKDLEERLDDGFWDEEHWKDCKDENVFFRQYYRLGYKIGRVQAAAYTAVLMIDLQYATNDPRLTNFDVYGDMIRYQDVIDMLTMRILRSKVPEILKLDNVE